MESLASSTNSDDNIQYTLFEQILIFGVSPLNFLFAVYVLITQFRNRKKHMYQDLNNCIWQFYDYKIQGDSTDELVREDAICQVTGGLNILSEMMAFLYLLSTLAHIITALISITFTLAIFLTFGFGLSVPFDLISNLIYYLQSTLTCGIALQKEKSYGDLSVVFLKQLQLSCLIFVTYISPEQIQRMRKCFSRQRTKNQEVPSRSSRGNNQKRVNFMISDEDFKKGYSPNILQKSSTLVLKTSFHLINYILMGMCQTFLNIQNEVRVENWQTLIDSDVVKYKENFKIHKIDTEKFMTEHQNVCIYDINRGSNKNQLEIVEYAPEIFKAIRMKCGITEEQLFTSFSPIYNIQAIHNFFTGAGKSQSFFFFSDNKNFVLKTLKESEKKLLLEKGILENYYQHMMKTKNSLLSKFYGVYTIRVKYMQEVTCFIMDNLLGQDFINIQRIYDLKGSTKGRIVKLTEEEDESQSGLKVLKDLNYLRINEKINVAQSIKRKLLQSIQEDLSFLRNNRLMDYSLLLIKVKNTKQPNDKIKRMPALIYIKQKNGNNRLQLRQLDDIQMGRISSMIVEDKNDDLEKMRSSLISEDEGEEDEFRDSNFLIKSKILKSEEVKVQDEEGDKKDDPNIIEDLHGEYKYKLGIIDFLTEYNAAKKIEKTWNNIVYWKDRQQVSCQDPETYAERFHEFMKEHL
ncbi:phosphatidylinositol phosphate kinase pipk5 [Stylonychia lemnae]|uniref:Phosphatidylinositol phosphate kinase pipk5 n=1 Tax=Stylonychia lemnae TaxID=5949 RepID=A0A078ABF2_STYLE|nr:phosphatidylinositol phosphate kinase pipk5 [Stylonychia lemnae]|eukprot:CDW79635.1 phosphatidylinositol phosphate kinase pipk5 [Stylonychia lemnae]